MVPGTSPKWVLILIAIAIIVAGLAFDRGHSWWKSRQAQVTVLAPIEAKVEATDDILKGGAKATADRNKDDRSATKAADTFRNDIARSTSDEPENRDRADRPVPVSVRNAFRAQRLALERSNGAAADGGGPAPESDAPER